MFNWKTSCGAVLLCVGAAICSGCGTSTEGSRYLMQNGVSDSGYPPKGSSSNPGSPALGSLGEDVNDKGIEAEPRPTPKQEIPPNLATTPKV